MFGVTYVISGVLTLIYASQPPLVLPATLRSIAGALMAGLAWPSYKRAPARRGRSWSALCAVFAICELFGAPKVARAFDLSLWTLDDPRRASRSSPRSRWCRSAAQYVEASSRSTGQTGSSARLSPA